MTRVLGVLTEREHVADILWNQCDAPMGAHAGWTIRAWPERADAWLCFGTPIPPAGSGAGGSRPSRGERFIGRLRGADLERARFDRAWQHQQRTRGMERERTLCMFYEPPTLVRDAAYASARAHAREVYGPDDRATRCVTLPSLWYVEGPLAQWRAMETPAKGVPLACVTSGKAMIPGHEKRLEFLRMLRRAGVDMALFGRGVPGDLGAMGPVMSKASAMLPARCALAIENHDAGEAYVTEKLWDALLCWCLPLYYGPRAVERLVPEGAIVRLPDLGAAGVEVVREAVADEGVWRSRLDAIAEARRRAMGEMRMVEWVVRELHALGIA
ncbi:MAG: glycosyltransferase family 10 [Phycisphaerales bacterium]|jgi:hypothetical protein|nr:glycosyltransferase family 10 [Phycisphaerales bacterium]